MSRDRKEKMMKNRAKFMCAMLALAFAAGCVEDRIISLVVPDRVEIADRMAAMWLGAFGLEAGKTIVKPDWPERD